MNSGGATPGGVVGSLTKVHVVCSRQDPKRLGGNRRRESDEIGRKPFAVVYICTGNRFRSPVAAGFTRAYLASEPVGVLSAGVLDSRGGRALPDAVELTAKAGVDISPHRSRNLSSLDLSETDLVLCFERSHLASAVVEGGAPVERVFLFLELLELLEEVPHADLGTGVDRARRLVARAGALRPDRLWPHARFEFPDPLGGPPSDYRRIVSRLQELCAQLTERLFGLPA